MAINSISASLPAANAAKPAAPLFVARIPRSNEATEASAESSVAATDLTPLPDVASPPAQNQPSRQQVDQAMEKMRDALPPVARNLQFSVDVETGRNVVKIVDATTNEVIRQMPSEELLAIAKALDSFTGLLLKQKA
jgi:flagellar protein FlaG